MNDCNIRVVISHFMVVNGCQALATRLTASIKKVGVSWYIANRFTKDLIVYVITHKLFCLKVCICNNLLSPGASYLGMFY